MRGKVKKASWPDYVKSHTTQSFLDTLNIIQVVKSCSKYKKFILFFSQLTFGLKGGKLNVFTIDVSPPSDNIRQQIIRAF